MKCAVPLAYTGVPVGVLLALGALAVLVGVVLVGKSRARVALVALPLLLLGVVAVDNRQAVADDAERCVLTIAQTSVNTGLAPGAPPSLLTAEITNRAPESTVVTAVTVRITGVVKAAGAVAGPCDAGDYVLLGARMPIGRTLAPYETVPFSGARIGFNDKSVNQDACKGATIDLGYTSE